ncbi:penicillin-binding transpeptidase domain-containing protein [Kineococcus radiotolerans]|uniref:Beta-lactamase n=1 Tax=Kineococcus radiotolerans (strain ATCC BAA-149 / DSM 14245 / SRS30216) TaxID=266940 RepID=A6W576_KINRD|nr:penicillin-binding transpeptidase domain-containing protein [Kineococcus radiotolerans]ABS01965.1 penicillin-binding protein transpeptidase [Kineococcus radiotolerans SRS30216 = ATCC BAA-149]
MTENADEPRPSSTPPPAAPAAAPAADLRRRPRRRAVVAGSAAAAVLAGGGALWWSRSRRDPAAGVEDAARSVAQAWSQGSFGQLDAVAAPGGTLPADLGAEYARLTGPLSDPPPRVTLAAVDTATAEEGTATATLDVSFDLAAGHGAPGGSVFAYPTTLRLARSGEGDEATWRPVWEPALVHPRLASGATFAVERELPPRADVLGRDGSPVVTATPVVRVGVQPSRTTDPAATAGALAAALGVDAAALTTRVQQAAPDAFVDVITLRRSDYDAQRDVLRPVPGAVFAESTLPLAPTRGFARALLGSVGPATAETIEAAGGRYAAGDLAGLSGVQAVHDERLAGRAGIVVRAEGGGDATSAELFRVDPLPGRPVRTSLVEHVQRASDDALAASPADAALVAVDVATGDVVAVSNFPVDGGDRALTGRFPPGSTFKVVTTLALLGDGLDVEENVPCAPTYTVEGRTFSNFEDEAFGDVPFRTDFARSCNTAFASLSTRLGDDSLPTAAAQLGIGAPWAAGVDAFEGSVPVAESAVDLAAASFGQGRTLVSPLAVAVAAASVAARELRVPAVVLDPAPAAPSAPASAADPALLGTLADLMRDVVTAGTATVLAGVPGEPVHAKTGTAEHGTAVPPATHAWTTGFQGGLAFAVFVADGVSGGAVAAPLAADFLRRVAASGGF